MRRYLALLLALFVLASVSLLEVPKSSEARGLFADLHLHDLVATASFSSIDELGIQTDVFVYTTEEIDLGAGGKPESNTFVLMGIEKSNILSAECGPLAADVQISGTLDAATLTGTFDCFDFFSETSFGVSVNLTWTATGAPRTTHVRDIQSSFGVIDVTLTNATSRPAVASGSVSDGSINFTPNSSVSADISRASAVSLIVCARSVCQ